MIRGMYTGASGMMARMHDMDALSNNLANADVTGYKRDISVHRAFPELLLRRMNDDGVFKIPPGSVDVAPVIGKIGTGVEYNESFTAFEQGALKQTDNPFDLALDGKGFFTVQTPTGQERYTRDGSFHLSPEGILVTKNGLPVMGENGIIQLKMNNFVVDKNGYVWENSAYADDPERLVSIEENEWESIGLVDRLKIVDFPRDRYLRKEGNNLWRADRFSGEAVQSQAADGVLVQQGFLEGSNVNAVTEMVKMIEINRAYEANQKVIQTHDQLAGKLINEVIRL